MEDEVKDRLQSIRRRRAVDYEWETVAHRADIDFLLSEVARLTERCADREKEIEKREVHFNPNWLWCGHCQGWIETQHVCGAQYIERGTHFEEVPTEADTAATAMRSAILRKVREMDTTYSDGGGLRTIDPRGMDIIITEIEKVEI